MKTKKIKGDIRLFPRGKGGWIRIVEAFVAILLIAGVVLMILDKGYIQGEDPSVQVYEWESGILKEVQLNNTLRMEIINAANLPVNWSDFAAQAPLTMGRLQFEKPSYLDCEANICELNDDCLLGKEIESNVYARSVAITENGKNRKLKLFCWEK